jgi:hypothetical protein
MNQRFNLVYQRFSWLIEKKTHEPSYFYSLVQKYLYRKVIKSINIAAWLKKMQGGIFVNKFNFVKPVLMLTHLIDIKNK